MVWVMYFNDMSTCLVLMRRKRLAASCGSPRSGWMSRKRASLGGFGDCAGQAMSGDAIRFKQGSQDVYGIGDVDGSLPLCVLESKPGQLTSIGSEGGACGDMAYWPAGG